MISNVLPLLTAYGLCFTLMNIPIVSEWLVRLPLAPQQDGSTFFGRMFNCAFCTGFHCGWISWALWFAPKLYTDGDLSWLQLLEAVGFAFASSAVCYLLDLIAVRLDS